MVKDLVCGMEIDANKSAKVEHKGETFYFCSPTCQWAFQTDPESFIKKES
jgi:Cu+-exporting ATPase